MSPAVTGRPPLRPVRSLPLVLTPDTSTPSRSLTSQNSTLSSERSAAGTGAVYEDVEEAKGEQVEQGEDDKLPLMARYDKSLKPLPWIKAPVTGNEWIWVKAKDEAPEWLSLLFDLQHPMSTPGDIPIFLSFFVIVFWTWVSQTAYDVRYQANDVLNRFWKFLQIVLFLFQGASAGHWAPGRIRQDVPDQLSSRAVSHVWAQARECKRRTRHLILSVTALCLSTIFALVAVSIPAQSRAQLYIKLIFFYGTVIIELAVMLAQVFFRLVPPVSTRRIAERYGAFGLIILGDAILSISRAFNISISGLSDTDPNTYAQVFLVILVIFLLWVFLFNHFDVHDKTGHGRAILWQLVHFPLSFAILIMVAAMVNVVIVLSSTAGIELVTGFTRDLQRWMDPTDEYALSGTEVARMTRYLDRLDLQPRFPQMLTYLEGIANGTNQDPIAVNTNQGVVLVQYLSQIVYRTYQLYESPSTAEAEDAFLAVSIANTTRTGNTTEDQQRAYAVIEDMIAMTASLGNASLSGTLWLLPASGAVLICTAIRSHLWSRLPRTLHLIQHGTLLIAGAALLLLSLLTLGPKDYDPLAGINLAQDGPGALDLDPYSGLLNPFYRLLYWNMPLVLVAAVFFLAWLVVSGSTFWYGRHGGRSGEHKPVGKERRSARGRAKPGIHADA